MPAILRRRELGRLGQLDAIERGVELGTTTLGGRWYPAGSTSRMMR